MSIQRAYILQLTVEVPQRFKNDPRLVDEIVMEIVDASSAREALDEGLSSSSLAGQLVGFYSMGPVIDYPKEQR